MALGWYQHGLHRWEHARLGITMKSDTPVRSDVAGPFATRKPPTACMALHSVPLLTSHSRALSQTGLDDEEG